jgi:chromosome segregation ATPase
MSAAAGEGAQQSPEQIRADIEQTREELGDTVEALAAKTDLKAQAKERIAQVRDTAQHKKDELASRAREATPESAGAGAQQLASTVKSRPVPYTALGAFAGGVLVGWILRGR